MLIRIEEEGHVEQNEELGTSRGLAQNHHH